MTPDLSVLLPVRDGANLLHRALDSVLSQVGPSFEVVVVDDGSTDDTAEVLEERARGEPRLRVFRQAPSGLVAALNNGLAQCRAPIVARQDHDDVSRPGRFAALADLLSGGSLAAADTGIQLEAGANTGEGMHRWARWHAEMGTDPAAIARERYVDCPLVAMAFRRQAVADAGGYRELGWNEDHDLCLRLLNTGHRLGRVAEALYVVFDRPDRLSRTAEHTGIERLRALKAHMLARFELRPARLGGRAVAVWGAGRNGKRIARALRAEGAPVDLFVEVDPRKIGKHVGEVRIVDPTGLGGPGEVFVLGAVGKAGGREDIREHLKGRGFVEEQDFLAVA